MKEGWIPVLKVTEIPALAHLRPSVSMSLDRLHIADRSKVGVDNAVVYLLQQALSKMEKAGSTVSMMFFDFSSAFNTIQPGLLREKLQNVQIDALKTSWINDCVTDGPLLGLSFWTSGQQHRWTAGDLFCRLSSSPCTLLSFSTILESIHLQQSADDAAVGCISSGRGAEYRDVVDPLMALCRNKHLLWNVAKTKEDGSGLQKHQDQDLY